MKRAALAFCLCLLHLAFIALPELQLWQYISLLSQQPKADEIAYNKNSNSPLVGDITYLNALVKRAKDSQENKQENTIPEISISHTGLIYLVEEAFNNQLLYCKKLSWAVIYKRIPLEGILKILAPPPKPVFV